MDATRATVLVVNSGSSSVKYELFSMAPQRSLLKGEIERVGTSSASLRQEVREDAHAEEAGSTSCVEHSVDAPDHDAAMAHVLDALAEEGVLGKTGDLSAIGHRVVHGGAAFADPVLIDDEVVERVQALSHFAPLHIGANLAGVAAARSACPDVPHVAVFDTAFHRTMPRHASEYALPRSLADEHGIRRYGFHGTSHEYVARRAALFLGRDIQDVNLITLHLGNGASATAVRGGNSVDTSMGMTPLEGLVMGTRCGDIDPAVPLLIHELAGASEEDVHRILNHESGLLGLCGTHDMRQVRELADSGDPDAELAFEIFCYRVKKYVGAYSAVLGHVDALVFTAGIGENDAEVRARACEGLELLGIEIDEDRNCSPSSKERTISSAGSRVAVLVIPTDEEAEIARLTYECLTGE